MSGGLQDFTYLFTNSMELTVEVSCCKRPPVSALARHWRHNYHAMLAILRAVDGGVAGLVLDPGGSPVCGAQVVVEGVDKVTVTSDRQGCILTKLSGFKSPKMTKLFVF